MPPHVAPGRVPVPVHIDVEMRATGEQFFEHDDRLQARRGGSDAIVRAVAEGEDLVDLAFDLQGLSVVGTDRLQDSGYFRAKLAQEQLIKGSGIPYTIVRATQFFEFLGAIAASGTTDNRVRMPNASFQPIAAEDVAAAVAAAAVGSPANGTIEIAGPERLPMSELVARYFRGTNDPREVVSDPDALYFGVHLDDDSLVPGKNPRLGTIRLGDWLDQSRAG